MFFIVIVWFNIFTVGPPTQILFLYSVDVDLIFSFSQMVNHYLLRSPFLFQWFKMPPLSHIKISYVIASDLSHLLIFLIFSTACFVYSYTSVTALIREVLQHVLMSDMVSSFYLKNVIATFTSLFFHINFSINLSEF